MLTEQGDEITVMQLSHPPFFLECDCYVHSVISVSLICLAGVHGGSSDRGVHVRRHDAHPLLALHGQEPQGAHPQVHPRHATGVYIQKQGTLICNGYRSSGLP